MNDKPKRRKHKDSWTTDVICSAIRAAGEASTKRAAIAYREEHLDRHALSGLQIAYDSARSYEDRCWYGFLIEVCKRPDNTRTPTLEMCLNESVSWKVRTIQEMLKERD